VNIDGSRHRDPVDCQFLIVDTIGGETGEQDSDQGNEGSNETQPNHSITQTESVENKLNKNTMSVETDLNPKATTANHDVGKNPYDRSLRRSADDGQDWRAKRLPRKRVNGAR
jgi:hypothetical protein